MASAGTQPATAGNSQSHPYTCNTCQVAYRSIELQKGHMKSDWHRYNLKRRVASLPPISADTFTEKVLQARAVTTAEEDKALFERVCEPCAKTYFSENAYQNHLLSQKHKNKISTTGQRPDDETTSVISSTFTLGEPAPARRDSVDSAAEQEFNEVVEGIQRTKLVQDEQNPSPVKRPSNPQITSADADAEMDRESNNKTPVQQVPAWSIQSCIFCNYSSPTVPLNILHMERFHGMFVPEKAYLVDLDGLVKQLQEKVHEDHECLYCGKVKSTVFGIQTHMRDTGHCKIPFTTERDQLAIGDFYDFRSTYSDGEDDDESDSGDADDTDKEGGAKLGARRTAKTIDENGEEIEEGDGWETDSSASSLDSEDLHAVPAEGHLHQYERLDKHPHHSSRDPRQRHQADGWHSYSHKHTRGVFYDDYELHLPTGKSVGHRSMNKYYRQNLYHYPTAEERAERQAIEAARSSDDEEEGDNQLAVRNGRERAVIPRGARGMAGVSDKKRMAAERSEQRGRTQEQVDVKKKDYAYGKKLNNQKTYYYRYQRGG
ncbi:Cytoplasmic 60S subunit biogenesis factor-like protein [Emericellopsis cladophorae]|uniref:Cytoplasmic 60S subunit biogenesis factor-like protein n=1 Tax=Emericellopsis cladophorae TaxID=2686198 RepID=A0A9P9Y4U8_9HYPO|nr:Cytoplasmic 60S subunit biogenesis factor-like protein [Emericellopsis cladophorae]KAI6783613.1 Cytoplasmic 60S subunit biogenesis factor-like protein [Emericellopsis cladophorae]